MERRNADKSLLEETTFLQRTPIWSSGIHEPTPAHYAKGVQLDFEKAGTTL